MFEAEVNMSAVCITSLRITFIWYNTTSCGDKFFAFEVQVQVPNTAPLVVYIIVYKYKYFAFEYKYKYQILHLW